MPSVVLAYHDVVPGDERRTTGFTGPGPDRYKLDPARFAEQLDLVRGASVELTFDDGGRSALDTIAPLLEERGLRGRFFVVTALLGGAGFLDRAGVRELVARGHAVGSHSHTHPVLTRLADDEIVAEWRRSREILEELLDASVPTASVPRGYFERRVARAAAAAGYMTLYTSEPWTRVRPLEGIEVRGRFAVTAATPTRRVGALARRSPAAVAGAQVAWQARRGAKLVLGAGYERLRQAILSGRG